MNVTVASCSRSVPTTGLPSPFYVVTLVSAILLGAGLACIDVRLPRRFMRLHVLDSAA